MVNATGLNLENAFNRLLWLNVFESNSSKHTNAIAISSREGSSQSGGRLGRGNVREHGFPSCSHW